MANGRNISPEKEYWDTSISPQKNPPFSNPTHTKKKKEEPAARTIFCSKFKAKHLPQEFPFKISTCHICTGHHLLPQGTRVNLARIEVDPPSLNTLPPLPDP